MNDRVRPHLPIGGRRERVAIPRQAGQSRSPAGKRFEAEFSALRDEEAVEIRRPDVYGESSRIGGGFTFTRNASRRGASQTSIGSTNAPVVKMQ